MFAEGDRQRLAPDSGLTFLENAWLQASAAQEADRIGIPVSLSGDTTPHARTLARLAPADAQAQDLFERAAAVSGDTDAFDLYDESASADVKLFVIGAVGHEMRSGAVNNFSMRAIWPYRVSAGTCF